MLTSCVSVRKERVALKRAAHAYIDDAFSFKRAGTDVWIWYLDEAERLNKKYKLNVDWRIKQLRDAKY